jgi:hypothetical protein
VKGAESFSVPFTIIYYIHLIMNDGVYMFPEFEELRFRNYKSFEDFSSFFQLKNINVFIGRNN